MLQRSPQPPSACWTLSSQSRALAARAGSCPVSSRAGRATPARCHRCNSPPSGRTTSRLLPACSRINLSASRIWWWLRSQPSYPRNSRMRAVMSAHSGSSIALWSAREPCRVCSWYNLVKAAQPPSLHWNDIIHFRPRWKHSSRFSGLSWQFVAQAPAAPWRCHPRQDYIGCCTRTPSRWIRRWRGFYASNRRENLHFL